MKLKNLSRWDISDGMAGTLYFAQRTDELLFDLTLDTYKPPALNAPNLCLEALHLIQEIEKGSIDPSNLQHVIDELKWSLQNDRISKSLLDAETDYYTLYNENTPLATTKLRLQVLSKSINSERYVTETIRRLTSAVSENKKNEIDSYATALITSLVNNGMSKQWLHEKTYEFFFAPEGEAIDSPSKAGEFVDLINQSSHQFTVYTAASDLILQAKSSLNSFSISVIDPDDKFSDLSEITKLLVSNLPRTEGDVLVKIEDISCRDPYAARNIAFRRLDLLSDLMSLFHHRQQIKWSSSAVAEWQCCAFDSTLCTELRNPMEKAFDFRKDRAAKELERMIGNLSLRENRDSFQRFNRVADLHGMCISQNIPDNQLVNLWTAIETLIPSHVDGGSKIKQIISSSIPFICISYIRRIIDRLLFDLLLWDKWRTRKFLSKVTSEKGVSLIDRFSIFLLDPDHEELRQSLYVKLGNFHLLRNRIFSLSKELSNPANVIARLDKHETKVKWQLRRLYRARNLIVHTSQTPSYIETLIENGHDYLDSMIFGVMQSACSDLNISTIEQAFEIASVHYKKLRHDISSGANFAGNRAEVLVRQPYAPSKV